ncbi:MAG TPA: GGDEF domain-containing protein, partial [Caldimonas sp.]|nr:GGDEF domain-containing protein [Caldimonas sp.]
EAGETPESSDALATLIERIVRGIEKGGQNWTPARRKEGIQRVLAAGRGDAKKLQQRLAQLVNSWDGDPPATPVALAAVADAAANAPTTTAVAPAPAANDDALVAWQRVARTLGHGLQQALPAHDGANQDLARELGNLVERMRDGEPASLADDTDALVLRVERVLQHRHHLFDQLGKLCRELTSSLTDLAEDGSWVKGQCEAMTLKIDEGLSARGVRAVSDMLHHARKRQGEVRNQREQARDALKSLITQMLAELGELGSKTGNFHESVGRYAEVIERSDSLESLTGVVREMVAESRAVQTLVQQTQERLQEEHAKATDLTQRVVELEDEMRRLSDEVSTDQLTQIANRRGLMQAFEVERARLEREGGDLAIGLLDIDNFKRLNDELGHSAGDEALKSLAAVVSKTLRPTDRVARYGGEEFVVLLPKTPVGEGEQVLTRLQRSLTGGLFMHNDKQVFVTFSAGVTDYRIAERIEDSLERADQALYEAKRTGKNRTCIG